MIYRGVILSILNDETWLDKNNMFFVIIQKQMDFIISEYLVLVMITIYFYKLIKTCKKNY